MGNIKRFFDWLPDRLLGEVPPERTTTARINEDLKELRYISEEQAEQVLIDAYNSQYRMGKPIVENPENDAVQSGLEDEPSEGEKRIADWKANPITFQERDEEAERRAWREPLGKTLAGYLAKEIRTYLIKEKSRNLTGQDIDDIVTRLVMLIASHPEFSGVASKRTKD